MATPARAWGPKVPSSIIETRWKHGFSSFSGTRSKTPPCPKETARDSRSRWAARARTRPPCTGLASLLIGGVDLQAQAERGRRHALVVLLGGASTCSDGAD